VQHWKLYEIDTPDGARSPVVLHSEEGESRVVLIALEPDQELGDHQVKEAALVLVVAGDLFRFAPDERHAITTEGGVRLLVTLAPWPGVGHFRGEERAGASAS
jgi:hypothetical protein